METKIVWRVDPSLFSYLREKMERYCDFSEKPPKQFRTDYAKSFQEWILSPDPYRWLLVGYVEVDKGWDTKRSSGGRAVYFHRRYWFLKHTDLEPGGCPCEGVIPSSIAMNQNSLHYPDGSEFLRGEII